MSEPKTYTAADIERYHTGRLSAAERHAMERAALDDPFLADALEGYAFTQTPSADVKTLQQKLQLRVEKEKKRRGILYLTEGMKIAATLLIIAGAGWIVFQLFNPKEEPLAAKSSPVAQPGLINERAADSATVSDAPLTMQTPVTESQKAVEPGRAAQDNRLVHKAPAPTVQAPSGALNTPMPDSAKAEGDANRSAAAVLQDRAAGVTVSKSTDDATTLNEERKEATAFKKANAAPFEKNNGRFVSPATDTVKNVNVTLRRNELSPNETVVLNKRAKERLPARQMSLKVDSTEPVEGWPIFDDYIANNLQEPEDLKTKGLTGEVELSFDVNKEGEAVNIAVTKSLCDKCDEEAIRLLKEGPKWKKNKKKGKVKIRFPLSP